MLWCKSLASPTHAHRRRPFADTCPHSHLKFTIPLASVLSIVARPLLSRLDLVRIAFIITIAVTATIPWDSYLIRTGVWTYPEDAVLGLTIFSIPAEELFFFFIQTYITALLYIICNKPVLHAQYLDNAQTRPAWVKRGQLLGQAILASLAIGGGYLVAHDGDGTYMGLILAWACPFALITWSLTGDMILSMPWTSTVGPIMVPTMFLWYVDELSLRSGVWTIETGTKIGHTLYGSLEMEEAVFFLVTNTLIVFGIAAFDKAVAVCDVFPGLFEKSSDKLPIKSLLRARVTPSSAYDMKRIEGVREAVARLQKKSRSFYLASSVFPGRLRIDLTLL
jgi:15-cis-phytoene synthase/lycopene beta-cyclase